MHLTIKHGDTVVLSFGLRISRGVDALKAQIVDAIDNSDPNASTFVTLQAPDGLDVVSLIDPPSKEAAALIAFYYKECT